MLTQSPTELSRVQAEALARLRPAGAAGPLASGGFRDRRHEEGPRIVLSLKDTSE